MRTPSIYSNAVSPRSRTLRSVATALLVAICAMAIYGYFGLMPTVARSIHADQASHVRDIRVQPASSSGSLTRAQRVLKFKAAVAMAYWGVCSLLIVSVVVVAWLDVREISRRYVAERRDIWTQTVGRLEDGSDDR